MNEVLAGIDIGGTKIAVALETPSGERVASRRLPTEAEGGAYAVLENISRAVEEMLDENKAKIVAIGVGSPSPLDVEKGLILSPSNLRDWDRFPVVSLLNERFKVPVKLDNDANVAALGEYIYGAGRGYQNIFYITVSTGIGGGIVINGEIYHGVSNGAGELGHTVVQPDGVRCNCGSTGCLETICAGVHLARRARERLASGAPSLINEMISDASEITAKTVVEAARRKDRLAMEIWDETCRFLAIGVANIFTLLAPEIVVIGGGIAGAGELLFEPLRRMVPQFVSMIPLEKINIVPAALGADSGVCGALVLARKAYSNSYQTHAA
ncbi:MAG TPA: ROK family protein [Pyrinomonadaceae bacterium]|jgi:glucokinase